MLLRLGAHQSFAKDQNIDFHIVTGIQFVIFFVVALGIGASIYEAVSTSPLRWIVPLLVLAFLGVTKYWQGVRVLIHGPIIAEQTARQRKK